MAIVPPCVRLLSYADQSNWIMRILLQQISSGLYLKEDGWTKTPDDAMQFATAETARSYSYSESLADTFVVLLPSADHSPSPAASENIIPLAQTSDWAARSSVAS